MNIDLDRILETGAKVVDSAKKVAVDVAKEGKKQADLLAAQAKLAKMQRQLGVLVYNLAKNGDENPTLVQKYIAAIASLEAEIEELKQCGAARQEESVGCEYQAEKSCPQCGAQVQEDAVFCSGCGAKL